MTYLLTGASGFIGTQLVNRILQDGGNVNYAGRRRSDKLDSRAAFHLWSAGTEPPLKTVPDLDAVIHLAGEPISQRWTSEVKERIYKSRVEGTRQLVNAMERLKVKPSVLVSASAVGYYGERGDEVLTERSRPGSGFLAEVCIDWEREAMKATAFGVRVVLIRISVVLGPNGGVLPKMLLPFRLGFGGNFGSGKQWMPWIHQQDLVELLLYAAQNDQVRGPLNASAPNPITNAQFTKAMGRALHRPTLFSVPQFALDAMLGEVATFLVASQRIMPEMTSRSGFEFLHPEIGPALVDLTQ